MVNIIIMHVNCVHCNSSSPHFIHSSIKANVLALCWSAAFWCVNTMLQSSQGWTSRGIHPKVTPWNAKSRLRLHSLAKTGSRQGTTIPSTAANLQRKAEIEKNRDVSTAQSAFQPDWNSVAGPEGSCV